LCNSLKVINKSSELKRYRLVLFVQTIFVIIGGQQRDYLRSLQSLNQWIYKI